MRLSVMGLLVIWRPYISTRSVQRLFGAEGAYPYLANTIKPRASLGYRVRSVDIPATGSKRWSQYQTEHVKMSAVPVHHGDVPALAWRIEIAGQIVVVAGPSTTLRTSSQNSPRMLTRWWSAMQFRKILAARCELYARPSQLGRVAAQAEARMMILGHRNSRTRGRESISRSAMEEHYDGAILFANDGECWGL